MTWTYGKDLIVQASNQPGNEKRVAKKSSITPQFIAEIRHIAIDALKLVHATFSHLRSTAVLSPIAAIKEIGESVLRHCENLLRVCPNSESVTLVFDGPTSELKAEEVTLRYLKNAEDREEGRELISRLFNGVFDANERDRLLSLAQDKTRDGAVLSQYIASIKCYILQLLDARENNAKPVTALFAPADGEAVLVSLAHSLPDVTVFCADYDCFSHRLSRPWVSDWMIKDSTLVGEYMLRSDTFRSDFLPQCPSVSEMGIFKEFERYDSLLMVILHVLTGSDFFRWGKQAGLKGMGSKAALDFVQDQMAILLDARIQSNMSAFDLCIEAVFTSKQWKDQESAYPKQEALMRRTFVSSVLYFYYGWSIKMELVQQTILGAPITLANISTNNVLVSAGYVSAPRGEAFVGDVSVYLKPKVWTNHDFFGSSLRETPEFTVVSASSYKPYSDIDVPTLCVLGSTNLLFSTVRALGRNPHPSLDRHQLIGILKSTEATDIRATLRLAQDRVVASPMLDVFRYYSLIGKPFRGCEEVLECIRRTLLSHPEKIVHDDFRRARLPTQGFSMTDAIRMIRLVFGHISLNRIDVYATATLTRSTDEGPVNVLLFVVKGIVPSMKTCLTYDVYIPLLEDATEADPQWCEEQSFCACVAGKSTCSHKRAAILFIGLLTQLLKDGFQSDEIINMLPADVLDTQAKPIAIASYFRSADKPSKAHDPTSAKRARIEEDEEDDDASSDEDVNGVNDVQGGEDAATDDQDEARVYDIPIATTAEDNDDQEIDAFIASTIQDTSTKGCKGLLQPRQYHGNILANVVDVIANGSCIAGYPSVVFSVAMTGSAADRLNIISSTDIESLRPYIFRTLLAYGATKLPD
jgi:hypothetical protein